MRERSVSYEWTRMDGELKELPVLKRRLRRKINLAGRERPKKARRGPVDRLRRTVEEMSFPSIGRHRVVRVFYGTDRQPVHEDGKLAYSAARNEPDGIELGTCHVSIPASHETGRLEKPSIWHWQLRWNPDEHVTLLSMEKRSETDFYTDLKRAAKSGAAFVFVHGYNVSFEDAARRTAQIAFDLQFRGAPMMFSWPSRAKAAGYPADEATIDWTIPHLRDFLQAAGSQGGIKTLHVIAHSMGNRAVARALRDLGVARPGIQFNQVLLAAPDIDRGEFLQIANQIRSVSNRVTLYASSQDRALAASRIVHQYPRAGESGDNIVIVPDIDTIDASNVDTDFLAHSYFCQDWKLLGDIFRLVRKSDPPSERYGLEEVASARGVYWSFRK